METRSGCRVCRRSVVHDSDVLVGPALGEGVQAGEIAVRLPEQDDVEPETWVVGVPDAVFAELASRRVDAESDATHAAFGILLDEARAALRVAGSPGSGTAPQRLAARLGIEPETLLRAADLAHVDVVPAIPE